MSTYSHSPLQLCTALKSLTRFTGEGDRERKKMSAVAEDLEAELSCAVCLDVYKDPRLLTCGHNFCHTCLLRVWENQDANLQRYSCPECRTVFEDYPATQRNIKLSNIIERIQASRDPLSENSVAGPVQQSSAGDATCMLMRTEVCANHGKPWEFFCKEHKTCLCRSCLEEHKTHQYQLLEDAKAVNMDVLKENIRNLEDSQKQMQTNVEWLQAASSRLASDRAKLREQVIQLFNGIQETLNVEKETVLALVDNEKETSLTLLESRTREMEKKREELAWLITEANGLAGKEISSQDFMDRFSWVLERMLNADKTAPLCRVEKRELDRTVIGQLKRHGQAAVRNLSKGICEKLRQEKSTLMEPPRLIQQKTVSSTTLKPSVLPKPIRSLTLKPSTHFTLDPNTAHCNISISDDLLSAQWVASPLPHPAHPERFRLHPQVLCGQGLSRGEHTWQVEVGGTRRWEVGVTCKSRDQAWVDSCISWALRWDGRRLQVFEGHKRYSNPKLSTIKQAPALIQVHLDCGQKTLSFLTAEEGLLHRLSINASGPVFPGFYLEESFVKIRKQEIIQKPIIT
ncbi:E3 ubiquitin-protein ligase TRIM39-like isoform X1 [Pygocentrus nattereri]|uniref:E3 ubiquitin-protein ligase TRIM39-like isoform X1 n=2 Tax=Pygocentrus nattereri TaxID=42514 RepID=UPI000EA52EFC|nr:E3 ubiquitin-protein ligase TRIM39-like isoform X1 [Pygocentrus nattereri]